MMQLSFSVSQGLFSKEKCPFNTSVIMLMCPFQILDITLSYNIIICTYTVVYVICLCIHSIYMYFYSHSENDLFLKSSCYKIDLFSIQVSFNFLNFAIFYQPTHVLTTESEMANKQSFNSSLTVLIFFFYISIFFQIGKD